MDLSIEKAAQVFLEKNITSAVFSNPICKTADIFKVKIRKILLKNEDYYQFEEFNGSKTFHKNIEKKEVLPILKNLFNKFKNIQGINSSKSIHFFKVNNEKIRFKEQVKRKKQNSEDFLHNNQKKYLIQSNPPPEFLKYLNFFTEDGKIVKSNYNKFKQICRYLEFIESVLPKLLTTGKGSTEMVKMLNIVDFGCGKAYLSFALYYYLTEVKKISVKITGLDLKYDVISFCNNLALKCKFSNIHFEKGDISNYEFKNSPDMVISLHACNTATDLAIAKAVKIGAKIIFAVPCCQHEINTQIKKNIKKLQEKENPILPMLNYGIIAEKFSSLLTDTIRAKFLEMNGYTVNIEEFISTEHTPKNILIKAIKNSTNTKSKKEKARQQINLIKKYFLIEPSLEILL